MELVKGKNNYFMMLTGLWLLTVTAVCVATAYGMRDERPRWRKVGVFMLYEDYMKAHPQRFSAGYPPPRDFVSINLTDDPIKDPVKLDFARIRIREILQEMDTIRGVHFHFGNGARYRTLIQVMDILQQERAQHYLQDSDGIHFLYLWGE